MAAARRRFSSASAVADAADDIDAERSGEQRGGEERALDAVVAPHETGR